MDLQLGLSLPSFRSDEDDALFTSFTLSHKKRSFNDLLHHHPKLSQLEEEVDDDDNILLPTTLPLLPLTPSLGADLDDNDLHTSSSIVTKYDGDDGGQSAAVGWPPLMSQRKKLHLDHEEEDAVAGIPHKRASGESNNALYVKVRMEGEGIGRKIDLSLHHSFLKLKQTLIAMFGKCNDHSDSYELAYQDREGDWLLAEDLPWKNFLQCAQRLKLLKRTG
ncbi:hypothetical protein QN277_007010 [Acacia crassicarpa]|uniref:Auxin-induced protein n=1 Tax=Acacia crassicarpa TaxID=499986 RepID=A0AAE1IV17_9FABA|nr:hypothetical protein QN277_007010 [Acacia crassicarpa]